TRAGALHLCQVETGETLNIQAHRAAIVQVLLSPDESLILCLSEDGTASVWTWAGERVALLRGHRGGLRAASFSPDGRRVVTAGADSTLRVWEVTSGSLIRTLTGHKGVPYAVQWSPSGLHILSIGTDQQAILWSGRTFLHLTEYNFPLHIHFKPAFHPEGLLLAVPGPRGSVYIYPLLPDEQALINLAHEKQLRQLTPEEKRHFFLDDPRLTHELPPQRKVPRAQIHTVQPGETLAQIALRYGIPIEQLRQLNRLSSDEIKPGDSIIITYTEPE
ncbi:MAG: LysM peptidoglycan-binding domain-containing protein, partial [Bacteroidia bacterium]|nr:LysM peptidoglycan-binding domain-containing protein [Bacteroidia bacterium]MDW8134259.1 LysM peptidoglycan-binding domain-containing protein [Bacteroidia bacterium]